MRICNFYQEHFQFLAISARGDSRLKISAVRIFALATQKLLQVSFQGSYGAEELWDDCMVGNLVDTKLTENPHNI